MKSRLLPSSLLSLLQLVLYPSLLCAFIIPDPIVHFGIGAIAGGCGAIAYQPFDYVKAQIQSEEGAKRYQNNGLACFWETLQQHPRALLTGLPVSVTGVAPEKSVKLGVNDILKDSFLLANGGTVLPLWSQIVSGAVAGACQVVVSSPLDVIKVRLQTRKDGEAEESGLDKFRLVWQEVNGVAGLYRGVEACLIRDISFTAVCFPLYSALFDSGIDPFLAGAMSGVVSTFIATPADMVKTRILTRQQQTQPLPAFSAVAATSTTPSIRAQSDGTLVMSGGGGFNNGTMVGIYEPQEVDVMMGDLSQDLKTTTTDNDIDSSNNPFLVAKRIVEQEGSKVLFTGVSERCVGAIPRFGITLGAHEWLEHYASSVGLLSTHLPS
ncbi:Mitochondrial aspartate-glutamate transporter AGC1 [Seminavis robusta]|uniref:Mitochondrial aspartate-glutamate transporter AGC1 n=1 Tax=Seminavis robusta TaxID=568900 RepID=A0A9N8E9M5_9STRA|nr:Mitochondrial aspartate-glutamate transporter AGC1 [Seminavis robusta]|eukprot:Sro661_g183200.1 Mitochondrial aspartate-glutamate transporter AGC1 (380) ;mRNA; r:32375-33605